MHSRTVVEHFSQLTDIYGLNQQSLLYYTVFIIILMGLMFNIICTLINRNSNAFLRLALHTIQNKKISYDCKTTVLKWIMWVLLNPRKLLWVGQFDLCRGFTVSVRRTIFLLVRNRTEGLFFINSILLCQSRNLLQYSINTWIDY